MPVRPRLYTDFGLFTCRDEICADVNEVFMQLTGLGKAGKLQHLWQSPFSFHSQILAAIDGEARSAKSRKPVAHYCQNERAA